MGNICLAKYHTPATDVPHHTRYEYCSISKKDERAQVTIRIRQATRLLGLAVRISKSFSRCYLGAFSFFLILCDKNPYVAHLTSDHP